MNIRKPTTEYSSKDFHDIMSTNLESAFALSQVWAQQLPFALTNASVSQLTTCVIACSYTWCQPLPYGLDQFPFDLANALESLPMTCVDARGFNLAESLHINSFAFWSQISPFRSDHRAT